MKIALIGYGKMGKTIEAIALNRGHEVVARIDIDNQDDFDSDAFKSADVAIEFTAPAVALNNYKRALANGVSVVSGTTGWTEHMPEVEQLVKTSGRSFFWASNFSLGVNIFAAVNEYLAKIMNGFADYDVTMREVHHIHKLDAPSGTAITLAEGVLRNLDRKSTWELGTQASSPDRLPIEAVREGEVPGIHSIRYESDFDSITITHDAKNRRGFALGAVLAAEFSYGKKGMLKMSDMLHF